MAKPIRETPILFGKVSASVLPTAASCMSLATNPVSCTYIQRGAADFIHAMNIHDIGASVSGVCISARMKLASTSSANRFSM